MYCWHLEAVLVHNSVLNECYNLPRMFKRNFSIPQAQKILQHFSLFFNKGCRNRNGAEIEMGHMVAGSHGRTRNVKLRGDQVRVIFRILLVEEAS